MKKIPKRFKPKLIRSSLSIFSSLDKSVIKEEYKHTPRIEIVLSSKQLRSQRRLNHLLNLIAQGKTLNRKELKRYIKMCGYLGQNVPEDILEKYRKLSPIRKVQKNNVISKSIRTKARTYKTYIVSTAWRRRKHALFKERVRECEICGSCKYIQVHHLRYDKTLFGIEPSKDLAILCSFHHQDFHDKYKVKNDCHKDYEIYKNECIEKISTALY